MSDEINGVPEIIRKKRDGEELSESDIITFINAVIKDKAQPAQIGAWLMAVFLKGMTRTETVSLTKAMMGSGETLSWPEDWKDRVVDKHSTGGVGDKVSLVLAPALAACGMKVPMISGRGLAHTGGTLDKLEAIPGYCVSLSPERMREVLTSVGCCIVGQTEQLVPADKRLYAIRDVTATVSNLALITGSIISKKAAEGISSLVLDVKTGNGAFMEEFSEAEKLAKLMVDVSCDLGVRTAALLTSMDCPLGRTVGHALEVAESVSTLRGEGPDDLSDLVEQTGSLLLTLAGAAKDPKEGCSMISKAISDRTALDKFHQMLVAQGVEADAAKRLCYDEDGVWKVLTPAAHTTALKCEQSGAVKSIQAMNCARAAQLLGAGRERAGEAIDLTVGLQFKVTLGQEVTADTTWVTVHHTTPSVPTKVLKLLREALVIQPGPAVPVPASRVLKIILPSI